jgi:aconitate hydratase
LSEGFGSAARLDTPSGTLGYFRLGRLSELGVGDIDRLPYSTRVLLEGALRYTEQHHGAESDVLALARPSATASEVAFRPRRVLHQDFTGGAAMVDLAAMRAAVLRLGGDPERVNPVVPTDFVIDHSVQAQFSGSPDAFDLNVELEIAQKP